MLKMVPETPLQFGVVEILSRIFRAKSTGIRAEAPKMLWADSVSTTYLIYRIPYVLIRLRIPEEEWRGKDTSLAHLRRLSEAEILHLWTRFMESENESMVSEHGLSSEITQSPCEGSDTSEGSENTGSFEDSGRSDEEYSEDGASSKEGGFETSQVRRSTRESRAPVKEEQNGKKRYKARLVVKGFQQKRGEPSDVGALNDTFTQHKSEGFQLERKPKVQIEGNYVRTDSSTEVTVDDMLVVGSDMAEFNKPKWQLPLVFEMKDRCYEKQVLGYVLTVGVTTVEYTKSLIHLVKNLKICSWAKLVRILINEWSLSLLKILEKKSLAEMFTRERGYSQFNDVSSGYLRVSYVGMIVQNMFVYCVRFIVVSLKEGMLNDANVLFRTNFVNAVFTVQKTVTKQDAVTLLKWIQKFSMAQDIGARAAVHIFNRISFSIAKGVGAQIVSRLPSNLL
ncbi:hypothetical protein Tco_0974269 [Tanacetum coccineum]|uniref:Uncharacterized protein n=1 Tax=Tanacetum coccineum TaxID=301880 RepID=A0ABQ5EB57_9ASTR